LLFPLQLKHLLNQFLLDWFVLKFKHLLVLLFLLQLKHLLLRFVLKFKHLLILLFPLQLRIF
jgi:hypothetical protein